MLTTIKVQSMTSSNGNKVANQFIITTKEGKYFQSYESIIAFIDITGNVFLDEIYWDYSVTTSKYRNSFLNEDKKETQKKIKTGEYLLVNLNK